MGAGVEKGGGLDLHVGTDIVPCLRHFGFIKVNLIGDLIYVLAHGFSFLICYLPK